MVSTIFLVRHAEAVANIEETYDGWHDTALTPLGLQQATALKKRMDHEKVGKVFCSDLKRAKQTLELLELKCPIEFSKALRERSYGKLEGTRWDDDPLKKKHHMDPCARPPDGESPEDVQAKVWDFFQKKVFTSPEEKVLVLSHHTPLVVFACKFLDMPLERWRAFKLGNESLSIIVYEDGFWRVSLWNSMSALGLQNYGPLLAKKK